MTVSSTSNKAQFTGNGGTVEFPFTFKVFANTDLLVIQATPAEVETTQTLDVDYTVALNADQNNDPGGTVTMTVAPPTGYILTVLRVIGVLQETDITNGGGFYPETIEDALDRVTMLVQQVAEEVDRSVKVDVSSTATPDELMTAINSAAAISAELLAIGVANPLPIASGGTNATTAAGARTSLGATSVGGDVFTAASAAAARTTLGVAIGSDVQAYDANTLKANATKALSAGYTATDYSAGTKSSGTFTPDPALGNFQYAVNGGAHTLAPPAASCTMVIQYTNNASAGTITTSGFTKVTGSAQTTTNGDDFFAFITRCNGFSHLTWQALQ